MVDKPDVDCYSAFQNDAENRNRNFSVAMQDPELS